MTKRTSDHFMAVDDDELELQLENIPVTESCDVIRRKIRALIDNGEMKVGEFQKAINISPNAYSRFMGQHGRERGIESSVYINAWAFFKKRELRGVKTTHNKKAKTSAGKGGKDSIPSVEGVELDGEKEDKVPIYDTCDDVRKKINAHLKKAGVTQAAFLREASACFHKEEKKLTARQLTTFRSKKGAYEGNVSLIFYGAYVYFEKLRVKEGKAKSKKRQEMEKIHAKHSGLNTESSHTRVFCRSTEAWHIDSRARLVIQTARGTRTYD